MLDVKAGRGAFMKTPETARALAESLVAVGNRAGVRTEALLTTMDAPLGRDVGNALEVIESIETLKGRGPARPRGPVGAAGGADGGARPARPTACGAETMVRAAIGSGAGLEIFRKIIAWQGGDPRVVDDYGLLPTASRRHAVTSPTAGYVADIDAMGVARAAMRLGAGRDRVEDAIDPAVGVRLRVSVGDQVIAGQPLAELHYNDSGRLFEAAALAARRLHDLGPGGAGRARASSPKSSDATPAPQATNRTEHGPHRTVTCPRASRRKAARGPRSTRPSSAPPSASARWRRWSRNSAGCRGCRRWSAWRWCSPSPTSAPSARRAIDWRTVGWGMTLQLVFALIVLKTTIGQRVFETLGAAVTKLLSFANVGSAFVFGVLGDRPLWGQVMATTFGEKGKDYVLIFAFQVLPTIIFIAALFAILYYFGIMQLVVRFFAWMMSRVMRASGAETLNVAASIFMGQTEAPLTIRPFLPKMTQSELMTVMTSGMAHISGGIMAAYILFGIEAKHLLTAVIMTAPGTLMMAKLFVPETEQPETLGTVKLQVEKTDVNLVDAAGRGTSEGLHLAMNVGAMLISFLALVALTNALLGAAGLWVHQHVPVVSWTVHAWLGTSLDKLSLQAILGWVFGPIAWALGVPWRDAGTIGSLLGTRMVLNEFVAYSQLGALKASLDPRSFTIATFALCGFANFSSIGIQLGGIGALAPSRRHDLARLGVRAMIAGTLANFVTATIAGALL